MNSVKGRCALLILAALLLGVCSPGAVAAVPDSWKKTKMRESLYASLPRFVFDGKGAVRLAFSTRVPAPPACVHVGIILPGDKLSIPVFRKTFKERIGEPGSLARDHSIAVNFGAMKNYVDQGALRGEGLDFHYRVEVWNPVDLGVSFYEGRQRVREEQGLFKPMPTLTEGPFVDMVTHSSATIGWKTDVPTRGEVLVGQKSVAQNEPSCAHEVTVTGLSPDTHYHYEVKVQNDTCSYRYPRYSFDTAPLPGTGKKFRFAFMSDSRASEGGGQEDFLGFSKPDLQNFFMQCYQQRAKMIFFGGDLVDGYVSEARDLQQQLNQWKLTIEFVGHRIPVYELIGNHEFVGDAWLVEKQGKTREYYRYKEGNDGTEAVIAREFANPGESFPPPEIIKGAKGPSYEESVFSLDYANCHFACLNSNYASAGVRDTYDGDMFAEALTVLGGNRVGYLMENQLRWLEEDLKKARERKMEHLFVMLHEPPFPNGGHADSAMFWGKKQGGTWKGLNDRTQPMGDVLAMRSRFLSILSKYRVLALFTGHEHNYSRMVIDKSLDPAVENPMWQILSGDVGAPYYFQQKDLPWSGKVKAFSSELNCCIIEVEGPMVFLKVISPTGELLDEVQDMKGELKGQP
ncbi:MAG: metallophosphoesterase family protein [Candidatus Eremiobacteraeota bacterium]|nr:metallophosphoesterase family protein [Candidatus Eremiobacteraeota bacterium]